jgi:hypothetical protein
VGAEMPLILNSSLIHKESYLRSIESIFESLAQQSTTAIFGDRKQGGHFEGSELSKMAETR